MSVNGKRKKTKETNRFDFRGNSFFYFGNFKIALFLLFSSSSFFKSLRAKIVGFFLYEMRGENLHVFPEDALVLSVNRPSLKESTRASRKCN